LTEENPKVIVKSIESALDAHQNRVQQVVIHLAPSEVTSDQLRELKRQLIQSRGKCPVRIEFVDPCYRTKLELPKNLGILATPPTVMSINKIFGKEVVILQ